MPAYFYNHTVKNMIVAMMSMFTDIKVRRLDDNGVMIKELDVPIKFGPQSKYYMRRLEDGSTKRYYAQVPSMSIKTGGFTYNAERAVSSREKRHIIDPDEYDNPESFLTDLMPSPWDIEFTLSIKTESFQDFLQIVEQIIPFFNPSVYLRIKEFNTVNLERDIRVTLNSFSPEFTEEMDEETRRFISGELSFTADAWFYKPITDSKIIKKIKSKYGVLETNLSEDFQTVAVNTSAMDNYETSGYTTSGDIVSNNVSTSSYKYINEIDD